MLNAKFKNDSCNLLSNCENKAEVLSNLKSLQLEVKAIINSWGYAEREDMKDYACYYVFEKNLRGCLYDLIEQLERTIEEEDDE